MVAASARPYAVTGRNHSAVREPDTVGSAPNGNFRAIEPATATTTTNTKNRATRARGRTAATISPSVAAAAQSWFTHAGPPGYAPTTSTTCRHTDASMCKGLG